MCAGKLLTEQIPASKVIPATRMFLLRFMGIRRLAPG